MISIKIYEREIETLNKADIIKGSKNYFYCNISFDDFWNDYAKTIVFKKTYGNSSYIVKLNNDTEKIVIPHEVLKESGNFKIGIFGIKGQTLLPTLWSEEFTILNGSDTSGEFSEPTPDVYEQLVALALETREIANSVSLPTVTIENGTLILK